MIRILFLLLAVCVSPAWAAEENYHFDDPAKRQLFLDLTQELRCPMCQNQNIADSDAMIATDLRRKVYQLLQQGYNRQEVVDYMKDRYGDFVSYQPPVTAVTMWLWLLPVMFVFLAAIYLVVNRKRKPSQISAEQLAAADKLLEKDE